MLNRGGIFLRATAACSVLCILLMAGCTMSKESPLTPATAQSDGWITLFDGSSLSQWRGYGRTDIPAPWILENGQIVLTGRGGGDLITRETFADFELELEWQISAVGNSGIFFLADESDLPIYVHAPEIQILDDARHPDNKQANRRSGSLYDMVAAPATSQRPAGDWNQIRIRHQAGQLQSWQNGEATVDVVIGSSQWNELVVGSKFATWKGFGGVQEGHIGLQDHGDRVAFRNIRIRRLP